jgi:hypothetical protein
MKAIPRHALVFCLALSLLPPLPLAARSASGRDNGSAFIHARLNSPERKAAIEEVRRREAAGHNTARTAKDAGQSLSSATEKQRPAKNAESGFAAQQGNSGDIRQLQYELKGGVQNPGGPGLTVLAHTDGPDFVSTGFSTGSVTVEARKADGAIVADGTLITWTVTLAQNNSPAMYSGWWARKTGLTWGFRPDHGAL